jgi:hypothetical protein
MEEIRENDRQGSQIEFSAMGCRSASATQTISSRLPPGSPI